MDTTTSPNYASSSSKAPSVLALAATAAVAVWLGAFGVQLASAQTPQFAPEQPAKVSYSDLDIATPGGAHALLHRINAAAQDACVTGTEHSPLFPRAKAEFRQCVTQAVDTTVARINAPMVTAENGKADAGFAIAAR